ncbi:Mpo1-like protein [uncultured Winogradskyella sp.]|uniref:Mpo1 family 2-hydroxy fatty acid dioxygenase n=1 Tax=uncultured Winogradskyella sp. TaxID=395353 RepID=UPI00262AA710|nr:Mpo1-like protein [uncultured Winogradskyella sp.]|tara:strand:- start:176 stop:661 length:486 start_codon:yes stop_codon:yes gene_type:complete
MRKIDALLSEYAVSHQTKLNIAIHYVCVPLIFFSLIGLLASIPVPEAIRAVFPHVLVPYIHFGTLVIVLGLIYYLRLSLVLFIGMLVFSAIVLLTIDQISLLQIAPLWLVMLGIFVVSWIGQFIGHNHEGKKPSFLKDLQFLMIGPAWTMSHLFDAFKIKF